jgi:nitroreductase
MDVVEAIRVVRVVRRYRPDPISPESLRALVDSARHAGSSKNLQRWGFVVVRDRATLERLGKAGPYAGHVPSAAAVIALVTPAPQPGDPHSIMWDLGRAAQNLVLAAWAAGIGSCPVTVYEQAVVREALGLPDDRHCEYLVALGYPEDPTDLTRPPRSGGRLALGEVLHEERW